MKFFEVEVTRTVTDRRKIYVSAENATRLTTQPLKMLN